MRTMARSLPRRGGKAGSAGVVIQEVLEHRFTNSQKTGGQNDMEFKTRWLGYRPRERSIACSGARSEKALGRQMEQ
jgi:hypothetical protein